MLAAPSVIGLSVKLNAFMSFATCSDPQWSPKGLHVEGLLLGEGGEILGI